MRGLLGKTYNKLDDINFRDIALKCDINVLTETWSQNIFKYDTPGYQFYLNHRHKRRSRDKSSGGICIYFKDNLTEYIDLYHTGESIIILCCKGLIFDMVEDVYLIGCYFPA